MASPEVINKAVELLKKSAPQIRALEARSNPTERETRMLTSFRRIAVVCALEKGFAVAGADTTSEIVEKLAPPIALLKAQTLDGRFLTPPKRGDR